MTERISTAEHKRRIDRVYKQKHKEKDKSHKKVSWINNFLVDTQLFLNIYKCMISGKLVPQCFHFNIYAKIASCMKNYKPVAIPRLSNLFPNSYLFKNSKFILFVYLKEDVSLKAWYVRVR